MPLLLLSGFILWIIRNSLTQLLGRCLLTETLWHLLMGKAVAVFKTEYPECLWVTIIILGLQGIIWMEIGNCTHMLWFNENRSEALWWSTSREKKLGMLSIDCARNMIAAVKCLPFEHLPRISHSIQCFIMISLKIRRLKGVHSM